LSLADSDLAAEGLGAAAGFKTSSAIVVLRTVGSPDWARADRRDISGCDRDDRTAGPEGEKREATAAPRTRRPAMAYIRVLARRA
jgi:hypothetical protein